MKGELTFGLYFTAIPFVANNLAYILFGNLVKISFQGVQIERPREKLWTILKVVFQMTYQRKVSRKNRTRSIQYMIANVNAA